MRAALAALLLLTACGDDASGGDAGGDGGGACVDEAALAEVPSERTVTFELSGRSDVFVAVQGDYCLVMTIEDVEGRNVPLGLPYEPVCEDRPPPRSTFREAVRPSESPTLTWDVRGLETWTECRDCGDGRRRPERVGALRPRAGGRYRARFVVVDERLPFHCRVDDDDRARCTLPGGPPDPESGAALCDGSRTAFVDFDLPDGGDLVVPVVVE